MIKKMIVILLALSMCLTGFSVSVFADKNTTSQETKVKEEKTDKVTAVNTDEENDAEEPKAPAENKNDAEQPKEPTEKPDDEKVNESKSKIVKEELEKKKQERAEARIEAKDYISGLKELFKEADSETKKELLSEIATLKKELQDYSIGVFVKGLDVDFEKYDNTKPVIKEGRTLIPVRAISESIGAVVDWNDETKTITITKDEAVIVMQLDNKIATVNGEEVELEVAPTTKNGRTMVPIRFISENLNLNVDWDENSQTIVIEE